MAQRQQRGWLKKDGRAQGETWVLFLTWWNCDGRRTIECHCMISFWENL
jgi:hypothetical protein